MNRNKLLSKLSKTYPELQFKPDKSYYWSPKEKTVFYQDEDDSIVGTWTLLHELSHGLLEHEHYLSDYELILLEVKAWEKAEKLAIEQGIEIEQDHVQDCLDSYRDWQYKRSLCPNCDLGGMQIDPKTYNCMFCNGSWHVSEARFCRPYRRKAP